MPPQFSSGIADFRTYVLLNNKLASGRVELVITDGKLGYKLDGADTVIPFFNAIYITVNWQINILCNGTSFNHNMGSYRLKITRSGVTKISGQLPNLSVAHIYNPDNITVQSMHLTYTNITVE